MIHLSDDIIESTGIEESYQYHHDELHRGTALKTIVNIQPHQDIDEVQRDDGHGSTDMRKAYLYEEMVQV